MTQDSFKRSPIEDLLERGLDLYGQNRTAEAIRCWTEVLTLAPGDQRALDYLESAGVAPLPIAQTGGKVIELHPVRDPRPSARDTKPSASEAPVSHPLDDLDQLGGGVIDREAIERLLRERRYEEALVLLYKEHERAPEDASITRGIRALKDHLAARYGRELGSLDQVPVVLAPLEERKHLPADKRDLLRLIDGIATFGDVLVSSRFGRFETCRLLVLMLRRGLIGAQQLPSESAAAEPDDVIEQSSPRPATDPPSARRPAREASTPVTMGGDPPCPPAQPVMMGGAPPCPPAQPVTMGGDPPCPPAQPAPASVTPPAGSPDPYAQLFGGATEAYLRRDYDEALRLFEACVKERPQDRRAEYNLRKLKERKGSP